MAQRLNISVNDALMPSPNNHLSRGKRLRKRNPDQTPPRSTRRRDEGAMLFDESCKRCLTYSSGIPLKLSSGKPSVGLRVHTVSDDCYRRLENLSRDVRSSAQGGVPSMSSKTRCGKTRFDLRGSEGSGAPSCVCEKGRRSRTSLTGMRKWMVRHHYSERYKR